MRLKLVLTGFLLAERTAANSVAGTPSTPIPTATSYRPSTPSTSQPGSAAHVKAPEFIWGQTVVRGVNAGGWLVLEPWITPSIFDSKPEWVVDEWSYGQYTKSLADNARKEITSHWETWMTLADFESMAAVGLNVVRIPIGFWALVPLINDEPYIPGAFEYLKRAVRWSSQVGLKVIVDLHGVPGGQNGWDNSGHRGVRDWFKSNTNFDRSLAALDRIVAEFSRPEYNNTVTAVDIVNEPIPQNNEEKDLLKSYIKHAYTQIRNASVATDQGGGITVMFSAAYQGVQTWDEFMPYPDYKRVSLDYHVNPVFNTSLQTLSSEDNLRWYCNQRDTLADSNAKLWTVVGEFTTATTDCARWLNGRGNGARYDNSWVGEPKIKPQGNCKERTGDPKTWPAAYTKHLARSFETQTWVYEQASGWIYWTWKTEAAVDWSFQGGLTNGWIPTPITAKPHGLPCLYSCSSSGRSVSVSVPSVAAAVFILAATWL